MKVALFNSWGRLIAEQETAKVYDALALASIYANWQYIIVVSKTGRPIEMFVRL